LSPFIKGGLRGIIKKRRWWSMKIFFITYTKISNNVAKPCPLSPSPFHVEDPARGGGEGDKGGEVKRVTFFLMKTKLYAEANILENSLNLINFKLAHIRRITSY
jgi:hypothetical protein